MTDVNPTTGNQTDEDDLFDTAKDEFPSKFDLRDRLVVIYPTGKTGERVGNNGKPYTWYETTTVVLDDGPDGWQEQVPGEGGELQPNLVPSVAEEGPQVLRTFQWSAGGVSSRLAQKLPGEDGKPGSVLGRINSRKNKERGMAPSWSITGKLTDAEQAEARKYRDVCKAERDAITAANLKAKDNDAF